MSEYIEREKLLKDISETVVFTVARGTKLPTLEMRGANKVIDQVKSAPTADVVEVKHGKLIIVEEEIGLYSCSICGYKMLRAKCNYCPDCGAKLDAKDGAE